MSDSEVTERNAEYLSSWVGDEVKVSLSEIAPEELGFVIERLYPQKANIAGVQGTFREHEIAEDGPEEFIERMFGGGRYSIRARKRGQYLKGVRHITIAGDPLPLKETKRLIAELRGADYEEEGEEEEQPLPPWATPFQGPQGWQGSPRGATPYGPGGMPPPPPPHSPLWRDPTWNPYMKGVKEDDPQGTAAAIQAMAAVLGAVMPSQAPQPQTDPSHLIATAMQAANTQTGPMMSLLLEELKDSRKQANKPAPNEQMQLESFRAMSKMQTDTMSAMMTSYGEMMKAQAETQRVVMKEGLSLVGRIVKQAQDSDSGSLLEKLPEMLGELAKPFSAPQMPPGVGPQMSGAPGSSMMPGSAPAGMPAPAPGSPAPTGPAPAEGGPSQGVAGGPTPEQQELDAYTLHQAMQFIAALKFLVRAQPDPEEAWEQTMGPAIRVQQGKVREAIEKLPPTATGDDFAKILVNIAKVPNDAIVEVGTVAAGTEGGLQWLTDFWNVAPWTPDEDDEEEVEEEDLPFTKPPMGGTPEAPEESPEG